MPFKCVHCGQCCVDFCTQINISVQDIVRITKFLGCSLDEVMPNVGMKPFGDPQQDGKFDIELGLNIPCGFRQGGRCSVYPARPLNCRIFPHFFIGNFSPEKAREIVDPSHGCMRDIDYTAEEQAMHKKYADYIGSLIMEESAVTEKFMKENLFTQQVILPAGIFPPGTGDIVLDKQITELKIRMAMDVMVKDRHANLEAALQKFILGSGLSENHVSFREICLAEEKLIPHQKTQSP